MKRIRADPHEGSAGRGDMTPPRRTDPAAAKAWIDAYLAALPADQRAALQDLRENRGGHGTSGNRGHQLRHSGLAATEATRRLGYHAAKAHCSFFPDRASRSRRSSPTKLTGFALSKGTIKFKPDAPLPKALIEKLVRYRLAQLDAGAAG